MAHPVDGASLPKPALLKVLRHLNIKHRNCCAKVCRSWAEAAVAATASITVEGGRVRADSLQLWLHRHGCNLSGLRLAAQFHPPDGQLMQLPCPKLRELQLYGHRLLGCVDLASLAALPSLDKLVLKSNVATSNAAAGASTHLQSWQPQSQYHTFFCSTCPSSHTLSCQGTCQLRLCRG